MQKKEIGIALVNLGTPSAPTPKAVREFLSQFLSDTRVISLSPVLWLPILYGIVLRIRPARLAKLYEKIWDTDGSPMRAIGQRQSLKVEEKLRAQYGLETCSVRLAMRYGEPNLSTVLEEFANDKKVEVIILPLFPQYSATTTAAVFDSVAQFYTKQTSIPSLRFIHSYAQHPDYIGALAASVKQYWEKNGKAEKLLMSFHGIPLRYSEEGDPYVSECEKTANALAEKLNLKNDEWALSYQSRFGYAEWVKPYTDETIVSYAKQGVKSLDVISPAFSADCLETLEELALLNRKAFLENGGDEYHYIPALNDNPEHIDFLSKLLINEMVDSSNHYPDREF